MPSPNTAMRRLELTALTGLPEIRPGDDLARLIADALADCDITLYQDDILVVAQKIVSKAEGLIVDLASVTPSAEAQCLAAAVDKDARIVELILQESSDVIAHRPGVLIVSHISGCILANAGIDRSNVAAEAGIEAVTLLPRDPDAAAERLRDGLARRCGVAPGVLISDSMGRPWRIGVVGFALGVSGLPALHDHRGRPDRQGRTLEVSIEAVADELAAAAGMLMGQADESVPVVRVRGFRSGYKHGRARDLLRPPAEDLFR